MFTTKGFRTVLYLCMTFIAASCKLDNFQKTEEAKLKTGDNPAWAAKDFDDHHWLSANGINGKTVLWLRFHIKVDSALRPYKALGMEAISLGSFDAFWDGVKVGENGKIGKSKTEEIPGKHRSYFLIPDSLATQGNHIIALRVSNFYALNNYSFYNVIVADYFSLARNALISTLWMHLLGGAYFVGALYYLFLFLNKRKEYSFLSFSIICFLFFGLIMLEYSGRYLLYPYYFQTIRLELIGIFTFILSFLIPHFFTMQFSFPTKRFFLWMLFFILAGIYGWYFKRYDLTAHLMSLMMWIASFIVVSYAVIQKKKGSILVFCGILLSGVLAVLIYYDYSLFISFTIIIFCMLYLLSLRIKEIENAYHSSQMLSSRLEAELLKKSIQPHFLMNTLTSLIDWVEESPRQGVIFIEALASEFEIFSKISTLKLIPVEQEIQLCKSHLAVMKFRKEINYIWEDSGIDLSEMIPPGLIHTALENGVTHSQALADGSIRFRLSFEKSKDFKQYQLTTTAQNRPKTSEKQAGTGIRYMEARLRESYDSDWELHSESMENGWQTTIKIYKKS